MFGDLGNFVCKKMPLTKASTFRLKEKFTSLWLARRTWQLRNISCIKKKKNKMRGFMKNLKFGFVVYTGIISIIVFSKLLLIYINLGFLNITTSDILKLILSVLGFFIVYNFIKSKLIFNYNLLLLWWLPQTIFFTNMEINNAINTISYTPILNAVMINNLSFHLSWLISDNRYFLIDINFVAVAIIIAMRLLKRRIKG